MKKLPAFTLMELLVTMVLSTIVVAAAFTGYEIMAGRYGSYQQVNAGIREAAWMNGLLLKDMQRAQQVTATGRTILLTAAPEQPVTYEFRDEYVLRHSHELTDTFHVSIKNSTARFNQLPVNAGDLIDELQLEAVIGEEPERFVYRKNYPAAMRIKSPEAKPNPENK